MVSGSCDLRVKLNRRLHLSLTECFWSIHCSEALSGQMLFVDLQYSIVAVASDLPVTSQQVLEIVYKHGFCHCVSVFCIQDEAFLKHKVMHAVYVAEHSVHKTPHMVCKA